MVERPVAVVTGAATGVGAACARWFARQGYDVLVNYRSSEAAAEQVVEQCLAAGVDCVAVQGDVAEDVDCRGVAAMAIDRWNRIDILINSAGTTLFRPMSDLEALSAEDFGAIFAVNVVGAYQMVRAVAPVMARNAGGAVVNVSSIAGMNGTGSSYAYAASKGALNTLTLSLARNLAPRIRVNAVAPGMIEGRWLLEGLGEVSYERVRDDFARESALGAVATPDNVAETVGWLSTRAELMTGQLVVVDAGMMLGRPPVVA